MPYPTVAGKHAHDALVTPHDMLAYRRRRDRVPAFAPPGGVVVTYQPSLLRSVRETEDLVDVTFGAGEFHLLRRAGNRVGIVGGFGIGAPVAAIVVEDLIALGVTEFINIGTAGSLQTALGIGDLVLCTEAVRDEGVSHHYLAPAATAMPAPALTERLRLALVRSGAGAPVPAGPTWTIDTPYRETVTEARHFQQQGVQTVEMEAAAVFAVATHRQVAAAAAFAISDSLAELVWEPKFADPSVQRGLERLFHAAVDALSND